jgi:hypothetical protein
MVDIPNNTAYSARKKESELERLKETSLDASCTNSVELQCFILSSRRFHCSKFTSSCEELLQHPFFHVTVFLNQLSMHEFIYLHLTNTPLQYFVLSVLLEPLFGIECKVYRLRDSKYAFIITVSSSSSTHWVLDGSVAERTCDE